MEPNEIVRALKCCGTVDVQGCDKCPFEYCGPECDALCGNAADCIEWLQAELEASKRRESAAVDSLTRMANGYKDCGDCAYIGNSIGKCEYQHTGDCYKWRGPEQEGE